MSERERHRQLLMAALIVMPPEAFDHMAQALEMRLIQLASRSGEFHLQSQASMKAALMWATAYLTPEVPVK